MPGANLDCRNFTGTHAILNKLHDCHITFGEVLWASVAVGAQGYHDLDFAGWRGVFHRVHIGFSALFFLERTSAGLCLAQDFVHLDQTDKGAASYKYGMIMAKIVAARLLDIPWLPHVDRMLSQGLLTIQAGTRSRGDMVGKDCSGAWHVVEAKGRSAKSAVPDSVVEKAKAQAARVTSIHGAPPVTASACIASMGERPIVIRLEDPPSDSGDEGTQWGVNDEDFFRFYYQGIATYIREIGPEKEGDYVAAPLFPVWPLLWPGMPRSQRRMLRVGLLEEIYHHPTRAFHILGVGADRGPRAPESSALERRKGDQGFEGPDGIAILGDIPDWPRAESDDVLI